MPANCQFCAPAASYPGGMSYAAKGEEVGSFPEPVWGL